ncbi:MAG: hypothetical protein VYC27_04120, partial [Candidatus Thermoplasmatota archaeon]|nr:hypothetical protein [Candidatus Thermoplasmatota archaeon]
MAEDLQHLHDPEKAAEFARALGLMVGGHHPFVGDWTVKGLYAYRSGKYKGQAYFGSGGSESDRLKDTYDPSKPGESNQKYRPWNRDDPKIPEEIRQKLIRLQERRSTRTGQTSQPSRNLSDGGAAKGGGVDLSGIWQSFEYATNVGPVDRYEFRRDGERYYVVRPPGGTIDEGDYFTFDGAIGRHKTGLTNKMLLSGELHWDLHDWKYVSRREGTASPYTSRKEGENSINVVSRGITEDHRVVTPLRTGWYRIEHADGSLVERVRVHQDERKTGATNEFTATGDLTGDVTWYVEGHTVNVPQFGSTGTLQADGNIAWSRDGNKAVYEGNAGDPILNSESGMLPGEISLKGVHGKYLSATSEGRVLWNTDVAHVGEYFRVEQRQNGKIALRSAFDMYLSAQPDGRVECNRREAPPGGWEEFTVEYRSNDVVCLKSCHGMYLSAQKDGQWGDWTMRQEADAQDIQIEPYRKTGSPVLSEPILNSDQKYVFAPEHKGWHWHNDRARAMGGHIASVTSAEENEDITRISGGAPVWLGGMRKGDRYRGKPIADRKSGDPGDVGPGPEDWYWSDGRPWSYTNWGPGEPNNWDGGENRVQHLGKLGTVWNDVGEDWEGPAVYRIPANSTSLSVNVPRDESTDTVNLNHDGTDEVDAEPNKRRATIVIWVGIFLMIFGLPLLIIGSVSTSEDRLAMLIPGAVLFSVGVCLAIVPATAISPLITSLFKREKNAQTARTHLEVLSFNHHQPIRFKINNPPHGKQAWVGLYPSDAGDRDHGDRWRWLKDIDVNDASLPGQA